MKQPAVYIVANKRNGTLYTGVTSDLPKRAYEHRQSLVKGFSAQYGCKILIWFELHETMVDAITREKQIKAGSRARKLLLIEALKPRLARSLRDVDLSRTSLRGAIATKQSRIFLLVGLDCFAEPVIGRAFARPVGSQ